MLRRFSFPAISLCLCWYAAAESQWPNCSVRNGVEGGPAIVIDGVPHSPFIFVADSPSQADDAVLKGLRQAAEAGIKLFAFDVPLGWETTQGQAAAIVEKFCRAHPDGYFLARISLAADAAWLRKHPGDCVMKRSAITGSAQETLALDRASFSSEPWRSDTAGLLRKLVREIIEGPHGNRFIGVALQYGQTPESLHPDANEFTDYSDANLQGFRSWLRKSYRRDKALRAAWAREDVSLDTAPFPSPSERDAPSWGPFRDALKQRAAIDMDRFQNESVSDAIMCFAAAVKEATERRCLVGVQHGCTQETGSDGALVFHRRPDPAFGALLGCRDIDLIHERFSCFERGAAQSRSVFTAIDSVALHRKLVICEGDIYSQVSPKPAQNLIQPSWKDRGTNLADTLSLVRRDFGTAAMHRSGISLLGSLSDGRWRERAVWNSTQLLRRISAEMRSELPFRPEVAFVIDEESPFFLQNATHPVLVQSVSFWRAEIDRIGAPVGYYLQSDLAEIPNSVKLYVLADAFSLSNAELKAIKAALARGATVLWNYAPNLTGNDGLDAGGSEAVTGISVEAKFDDVPMKIKSALTDESIEIASGPWRPRFIVKSGDVDPVARYEATGEVSAAARQAGKGVSIYTATPRLPVGLMREICRRAGVHIYIDTPARVAVAGPYLFFHTVEDGTYRFAWHADCEAVDRLLPQRSLTFPVEDGNKWTDRLPANTTALYCCK